MYAQVSRFCLWDSPRFKETFDYANIHIEIIPNDYYDGIDPPDVIVSFNNELVLHAVARGLGGGVGGYKIKAFREGDWLNTIDMLYKKANDAFIEYRKLEKEDQKNRFSPID